MKAFRFSLQRALDIRRAQGSVEKLKYERLLRDLDAIQRQTEKIHSETASTRKDLVEQPTIISEEIATFPDYLHGNKLSLFKLNQAQQDLAKRIEEQRNRLLEVERNVKLLDKLRTRRLEGWTTEFQNEQERFASDAYLARWTISS